MSLKNQNRLSPHVYTRSTSTEETKERNTSYTDRIIYNDAEHWLLPVISLWKPIDRGLPSPPDNHRRYLFPSPLDNSYFVPRSFPVHYSGPRTYSSQHLNSAAEKRDSLVSRINSSNGIVNRLTDVEKLDRKLFESKVIFLDRERCFVVALK